MWQWNIKKAKCWRIDAFEPWCWRRPESPLDCKEIKPVNPKRNQSWIVIEKTDGEAEAPILWPLDIKNWLIGKDPDAGKDWGQEEKGATEDEMIGWHCWRSGHQYGQTQGDSDGKRSLACCSLWGSRVRHNLTTEQNKKDVKESQREVVQSCGDGLRMSKGTQAHFFLSIVPQPILWHGLFLDFRESDTT